MKTNTLPKDYRGAYFAKTPDELHTKADAALTQSALLNMRKSLDDYPSPRPAIAGAPRVSFPAVNCTRDELAVTVNPTACGLMTQKKRTLRYPATYPPNVDGILREQADVTELRTIVDEWLLHLSAVASTLPDATPEKGRNQKPSKRLSAIRRMAARQNAKVKDAGDRAKIKSAFVSWKTAHKTSAREASRKIWAQCMDPRNPLRLNKSPLTVSADTIKRIAGFKKDQRGQIRT